MPFQGLVLWHRHHSEGRYRLAGGLRPFRVWFCGIGIIARGVTASLEDYALFRVWFCGIGIIARGVTASLEDYALSGLCCAAPKGQYTLTLGIAHRVRI